jgi:hypothetical protein
MATPSIKLQRRLLQRCAAVAGRLSQRYAAFGGRPFTAAERGECGLVGQLARRSLVSSVARIGDKERPSHLIDDVVPPVCERGHGRVVGNATPTHKIKGTGCRQDAWNA